MKLKTKLKTILGVKGFLCLVSMTMIAFALVAYTAIVTINPTQQFTIGATTDTWTVYVNEVNQVRYLPGASSQPTFDSGNSNTYAFSVVTDAYKVCAVKIELSSAMNSSKFSNFDITVDYWDGDSWETATLYNAATGSTTVTEIDGLTTTSGYIHQTVSTTTYYLVKVTYSYDLGDDTNQVTATFQYTPFPQDSF
jgi:hypothetical protein